jgi:uncharacterized membrane protein
VNAAEFLFPQQVNARQDPTLVAYKPMIRSRRFWPWWRWSLTGLSAVALALSAFLGWHHLVGGSVIGCGGGSPCDQVLKSRWSTIGGVVPISGLAAGAYLAILVASLSIGPTATAPVRRLAWGVMLLLASAAATSAVWFIVLQTFVISAFCPYCTATHISGLLLAALVIWRAPRERGHDLPDIVPGVPSSNAIAGSAIGAPDECVHQATPSAVIGPRPVAGLVLVGLAFAGILAAAQAVFKPPAVYLGGESQQNLPTIDPRAVPLVGSPDAPYVVKLLFDYKCPHCQQMHFFIDEAIRRYGGKLAFGLCPTPLDRQCNSHIPQDVDEFKGSCELAKVGLAVWVANREAFPAFDRWMFSFESGDRWQPRTLEVARAKAVELVGQARFDSARADSWIDRYMQTSIRIYADTIQSGNGAIPKLVFGSRWVIPDAQSADDLVLILQNSLAVPKP